MVSRFIKDDGFIRFTVRIGVGVGDSAEKIDVDLENIYDYVTPGELERFEHLDWEEEIEREKIRRKDGRPRKETLHGGLSYTIHQSAMMKPLGRPRNYSVNPASPFSTAQGQRMLGKRVDSAFLGVHIPSPVVKAGRMTANVPSLDPSTPLSPVQNQSLRKEYIPPSLEAMCTSAGGGKATAEIKRWSSDLTNVSDRHPQRDRPADSFKCQ